MVTQRPSKYDPLIEYLAGQAGNQVILAFVDVERILGDQLPPAAYQHAAWWANSADDPTHSWARRWVAEGWVARVDLDAQRVAFRRRDDAMTVAPAVPPMRLEDLRPTTVEPVMDLVERAGINVDAWSTTIDGVPIANPRSNTYYKFDWSFGSIAEGFVLNLWFDGLVQQRDRIFSRSDVAHHRRWLEQLRGDRTLDVGKRSGLKLQSDRARDFEDALEQSWRRSMPVRVILNVGVHRQDNEAPGTSSHVDFRDLDDAPWFVHGRDEAGFWIIVRNVAPGVDEDGGPPPADDDDSPGADDYRRTASIKVRRGQPKFRADLIGAYGGRCAVTATRIEDLLEAAHIVPHREGTNYRVSNGLLLRADIHTLYDLHLLSVDERHRVHLSKRLMTSDYMLLHGTTLKTLPSTTAQQPSADGLRLRHERFLSAEAERDAL